MCDLVTAQELENKTLKTPTLSGNLIGGNNDITGINAITCTTLAGTLSTEAQPNITSLNTVSGLTSLKMAGNINVNSNQIQAAAGITMTGSITGVGNAAISFKGEADKVVNGVYTAGAASNGNITANNIALPTTFTNGITVSGTTTFNTTLNMNTNNITGKKIRLYLGT